MLHGADPFDKGIFDRCVAAGVSKVNINKVLNGEWVGVMERRAGEKGVGVMGLVEEATARMEEAVGRCIEVLGSGGRY